MATNKKPRKKYKPKPMLKDPVAFVVEGTKPASSNQDAVMKFSLKTNDAYNRIRMGEATPKEMDSLISAHNIMHALKMMKFGEGVVEPYAHYAQEAKLALLNIGVRFSRGSKKFTATGPELVALHDLVDALDEMLAIMPVSVLDKASALALREIKGKRAINTYKFPNLLGEENEIQTDRQAP